MNGSRVRLNQGELSDLAALVAIALGNLLLVARSSATIPALGLVGGGLVILIARRNVRLWCIPLLLPLGLFLLSGWLSISVSFDANASWKKFWLLAAGGCLYLVIAAQETKWTRTLVVWGLLLFCAGTGLFFVTQHDFARDPAKFGVVNQIGLILHRLSPQFGFHVPHANLIAGILLLGLPFAAIACWGAFRKSARAGAVLYGIVALWLAFGLAMTTSRGAILALGIVGGVGILIAATKILAGRADLSPKIALAIPVNLVLVMLILLLVIGGRELPDLANSVLGSTNGVPRAEIFRQAFHLGQDVSFTGIGLDTFGLNYASYALLIDVLFLPHAHDLYLQVWIEQGLVGIVAFGWLLVEFYIRVWQRRGGMSWLALAGIISVTCMLLHGVVDVLFYFSRVAPVMFVPFGLAVSALSGTPIPQTAWNPRRTRVALAAAVLVTVALVGLGLSRRTELLAQWDANQGAVRQAQLELSQYQFPDHILRFVRRNADESSAIELFERALGRDPNNRVANLRLGLIELDREEFADATRHLENAYRADPSNRATVKALGYTYVWTGKLDEAVRLLRAIDEAPIELRRATELWAQSKKTQLAQNANAVIQKLKAEAQ